MSRRSRTFGAVAAALAAEAAARTSVAAAQRTVAASRRTAPARPRDARSGRPSRCGSRPARTRTCRAAAAPARFLVGARTAAAARAPARPVGTRPARRPTGAASAAAGRRAAAASAASAAPSSAERAPWAAAEGDGCQAVGLGLGTSVGTLPVQSQSHLSPRVTSCENTSFDHSYIHRGSTAGPAVLAMLACIDFAVRDPYYFRNGSCQKGVLLPVVHTSQVPSFQRERCHYAGRVRCEQPGQVRSGHDRRASSRTAATETPKSVRYTLRCGPTSFI